MACEQVIENLDFENCGLSKQKDQLEIWSWNLKFFPQTASTSQAVLDIIEYYQPDIIAFQEISNRAKMNEMLDAMALYEGWVVDLSGDLDLAFAYNTCTVSAIEDPQIIRSEMVWPRPPALWKANVQGVELNLLNIHLKCCGDGVADRLEATEVISDYILNDLQGQPVVLLGDFNDEIDDEGILPFYLDSMNFKYADEHVSFGSNQNWSYPSWPSDIDHILVNEPLFNKVDTAATLLLDKCYSSYSRNISDHRAVSVILNMQP